MTSILSCASISWVMKNVELVVEYDSPCSIGCVDCAWLNDDVMFAR